MKKIPTMFLRNLTTHRVVDDRHPDCLWVGDPTVKQIGTRKYDGTCMRCDEDGVWWARREVKAGKEWPLGFELEEEDQVTHNTVGWVRAHTSDFAFREQWAEALNNDPGDRDPRGKTFELCGPKINKGKDGFAGHVLVEHGQHMVFDVPTDYEGLKNYLEWFPGEGIVFWAQDGRRAKIKKRDFGWPW